MLYLRLHHLHAASDNLFLSERSSSTDWAYWYFFAFSMYISSSLFSSRSSLNAYAMNTTLSTIGLVTIPAGLGKKPTGKTNGMQSHPGG